jgi:hypothetical protein
MAKEPVEELEQEAPEPEIEEVEDQVQEPETEELLEDEPEQPETSEDDGDEEVSIGFEDEPEEEADEADDTPTIKRIRERNRDLNKQLREREKELAELRAAAAAPKAIEVGPKPDLWEDCEGDPEKFEAALDAWKQKKAAADEQVTKAQEGQRKVIESYNRDLENYEKRKATIGVADYEDAEATVVSALSLEQQAVALQAASDPAALVVALAKSPAKLAELAKIDNPWKLSAAIAKLEGSVKVVTRKKAPNIDKPARGSAAINQLSSDAQLEKLEKEAERTGDRTKLIAFKRQLREQGK